MKNTEKIYTGLCILFCSLIVLGNLIYQKFVSLPIPLIHNFELSVGAILYPLTFLITDLITEFYGKEKASFCVYFTIFINILVASIIALMEFLPATPWSKINDATFSNIFGMYSVAFIGSMIACYTSQTIDIYLYSWIKKLTNGKYLWLRNNGSSSISLFIDTYIVISFMTLFKILPTEHMWKIIWNSYSWKLFFTICSTPLFYTCVQMIKRLVRRDE